MWIGTVNTWHLQGLIHCTDAVSNVAKIEQQEKFSDSLRRINWHKTVEVPWETDRIIESEENVAMLFNFLRKSWLISSSTNPISSKINAKQSKHVHMCLQLFRIIYRSRIFIEFIQTFEHFRISNIIYLFIYLFAPTSSGWSIVIEEEGFKIR